MMKKITIIIFFFIILSGVAFQATKWKLPLYGVTESVSDVEINGIWDGSWQSNFEKRVSSGLLLRAPAIRIRNQIMYSVFQTSPVDYIVQGKDGHLFEESYITNQLQIQPVISDERVDTLVEQLVYLQQVLENRGKKLFIFITPSKADLYEEAIPDLYRSLAPKHLEPSSYEKLIQRLKNTTVPYFDSVPFVKELKKTADYPVFTRTGIHWSRVTAAYVSQELLLEMERQLSIALPNIEVTYVDTPEAIPPDRDLEELLNLFTSQDLHYYAPSVTFSDSTEPTLSLLARGGSFMQSSILMLSGLSCFKSYYYMENTLLVDDGIVSYFNSYDEIDLSGEVEQADILLLEVNEEKVDDMGFGVIEYLIENVLVEE